VLVHICCAVDSHYFLQKLQKDYPEERLVGFFYDPNIHPYSEYRLRLLDVKRSCKKLGIDLIEGEYDFENWLKAVEGLENEPEKGARCAVCFDRRLSVGAQKALELGEKSFTTTLLVSPLKSQQQLKRSGEAFEREHGIKFIAVDYRSGGGTQHQAQVSKDERLYRQDYCGCLYGLSMQRISQERLMDEMFSPLSKQILPASIEERIELYERRTALEEQGIAYRIVKEKFLNYRLFTCKLATKKECIDAHPLPYSTLPRKRAQARIEYAIGEVHYANREEIRMITLATYNTLASTRYGSVRELIFSPPSFAKELAVRAQLTQNPYDLTPLLVVDTIIKSNFTLTLEAKSYTDTRENLVIINE